MEIKSRNIGIDCLRVISMFMVVILHLLGKGGVIEGTELFKANHYVIWLIEIGAYCAVNSYALITGYVFINSNYKYSKILTLWLQVAFYSVLITAIVKVISPETVVMKDIINSFIPVLSKQYWYFTAYFGMFFFIPFLNHLINTMPRKQLFRLIVTIVIIFTLLPTIARKDIFATEFGFSTMWLMCLYLIGAYIKKYGFIRVRANYWYLLSYGICILTVWFSKAGIELLTYRLFGQVKGEGLLIGYTSPFILFAGIFLLAFFSNFNFKRQIIIKLIKILSPLTFGVYLIHTHPIMYYQILDNRFSFYGGSSTVVMVCLVLATTTIIYAVCSAIEYLRILIFRLLKIDLLFENFIVGIIRKIAVGKVIVRLGKMVRSEEP